MKLNPNLKLWEVGEERVIISSTEKDVNLSNVYSLNETAAFLWHEVEKIDFNKNDLVELLCNEYDVDRDVAIKDIDAMVDIWIEKGLIILN